MIYLGTPGRMVGIKCPSSQSVDHEDRYTFEPTLEGKLKGQARPVGRRKWSLQTSAATTPGEVAALMGFVNGDWGAGPFTFVSADAPITNLLSPAATSGQYGPLVTNLLAGGPVDLGADGWAARSVRSLAPTEFGNGQEILLGTDFTPVRQGVAVTGSAWVKRAGGRVRLYWYGPDSTVPLGSTTSSATATSTWSRVSVTGLPVAGAVRCRLVAFEVEHATRPAITWSEGVLDYADGQGCQKAVVHAAARSLTMAVPARIYGDLSFTVTEVG
ncbi:hypothetical protein [Arthrobacter sp. YC-RL1]|uniref:hypothetical protein n=1 Tax=Arthrobacter sp. YC-RL1 TaxID=1652545 RepID=UPI000ADC41C8|nr:hypothetical protein [Arthrobacter sp. YC-RL1]